MRSSEAFDKLHFLFYRKIDRERRFRALQELGLLPADGRKFSPVRVRHGLISAWKNGYAARLRCIVLRMIAEGGENSAERHSGQGGA